MPRTTLDIDAPVLERLRKRAASEKKSMGQVASEALAPALASGNSKAKSKPLRLPSQHMGRPLVDIDNKEAMWKLLDEGYLRKLDR